MTSTDKPARLLRMTQMRERYSVSERTIDRWTEGGILPPPVRLGKVRHWRETDLEETERARMSPRQNQPDA